MSTSVTIAPEEKIVLRDGLKQLKGTIKNARRLDSALERDLSDLDDLEAERKELMPEVSGEPIEREAEFNLKGKFVPVARIAARLRHGKVARHISEAEKLEIEHSEASEHLAAIEVLGRKLGVQLDIIDHADNDEEEDSA